MERMSMYLLNLNLPDSAKSLLKPRSKIVWQTFSVYLHLFPIFLSIDNRIYNCFNFIKINIQRQYDG